MSNDIHWTDKTLRLFIQQKVLTSEEIFVTVTRVKGWTITQQAMALNRSPSTISRIIRSCRDKYDDFQKDNPDIAPVRNVKSPTDKYLDEH